MSENIFAPFFAILDEFLPAQAISPIAIYFFIT